jgi:lipid II:glycine glycyltransferase (peptidoglycan interpeptide bridge formation enzyme)
MITIRGRFATYGEIWVDEEPPALAPVDVLAFRLRAKPPPDAQAAAFLTLVSDLAVDNAAMFARFASTVRYEIKRADSKDTLTAEFVREPGAVLDEFCAFYDEFAKQKSLEPSYRRGLQAMCDAGQLALSAARQNGERVIWHAYALSGTTAALLHSASHFRAMSSAERAVVARANRWLHWRDMLAFKDLGFLRYDWGGVFEDESDVEHASINSFKRRFGGRPHRAYNCIAAMTVKGRAYLAARHLLDRVKQRATRLRPILKGLL